MDVTDNPRGKRGKRRKGKKTAAKKARKAGKKRRRNPSHASAARSAPRSAPRRRGRRAHKAVKVSRRRRRRNPAGMTWSAIGAHSLGGAAAFGVEFGLSKIPQLTGYTALAVEAAAPLVLGIAAVYAKMPSVGGGMVGVAGYKTVKNAIAAFNLYKATKALKDASASGPKGLNMGIPASNFAPMAAGVRRR